MKNDLSDTVIRSGGSRIMWMGVGLKEHIHSSFPSGKGLISRFPTLMGNHLLMNLKYSLFIRRNT